MFGCYNWCSSASLQASLSIITELVVRKCLFVCINQNVLCCFSTCRCELRRGENKESGMVCVQLCGEEQSSGVCSWAGQAYPSRHLRCLWESLLFSCQCQTMLRPFVQALQILLGIWELQLPRLHLREVLRQRTRVIKAHLFFIAFCYHVWWCGGSHSCVVTYENRNSTGQWGLQSVQSANCGVCKYSSCCKLPILFAFEAHDWKVPSHLEALCLNNDYAIDHFFAQNKQ